MTLQMHSPITVRGPQEIIAYNADEQVSIAQFLARAEALSCNLPDHRYVINLLADRYHYLLGFCAAIIAGQCTLMPPNRLERTLDQLARDYPDSYTLEESDLAGFESTRQGHDASAIAESLSNALQIRVDQLCAIAFTSGSTGNPSPNLKYWQTLRTGSIGNVDLLFDDYDEQVNMVATVPPQHMWGLETSILLPLFTNIAVSSLTPFYPQDIATALESIPEPRVLVSSPVHLNVLLKSGVRLVKLDRILSATAPVSKALAQQLEQRFDTQLLEVFGSSESGILARRYTADDELWELSGLFEIDVRQDKTLIVAEHLPEVVILQDAIELISGHRFRWLGRDQDMLNIAGKRGSLADLNNRLLGIEGVLDGVIFIPESGAGKLVAMVVAPGLKSADILRELKSGVESIFLPRPVYMVQAIPRQETGKLLIRDLLEFHRNVKRQRKS